MKIGDPIKYHSPYRTGIYDGTIIALNADGTVGISVVIPGLGESKYTGEGGNPLVLRSVSYGPNGLARPKGENQND